MYITKTNEIKNKKCEKGSCKRVMEKENQRCVLRLVSFSLEKRAVEVKDLKRNAVSHLHLHNPQKIFQYPRRMHSAV